MEWQPIETAPRDGRWVLLAGGLIDEHDNVDPADSPPVVVAKWSSDSWLYGLADCGFRGVIFENPTSWMPLPEPPYLAHPKAAFTGCTITTFGSPVFEGFSKPDEPDATP